MALVALLILLAILAQTWFGGRTFAARIAALAGRTSRSRVIVGWAAGTVVTYGASALLALALTGRLQAVAVMPDELRLAAWRLGLPASADGAGWILASLALGAAIGIAILLVRRWMGRGPIGLRYRSPAAVRHPGERGAAALLALAAGVGEELFFRLALSLAAAIVLGSGIAGLLIATLAFAAAHRHQGWMGVVATGLIGAGLAYLYLLTGQLWLAILLHVAIDLHALILRPWLSGDETHRVAGARSGPGR